MIISPSASAHSAGSSSAKGLGRASQDAHFGSKNLAFEIIVRDLPFLGVEHGDRHE